MKLHTINTRAGHCIAPFFTRVRLRHDHAETGGGWGTALRGIGCREEWMVDARETCAASSLACCAD